MKPRLPGTPGDPCTFPCSFCPRRACPRRPCSCTCPRAPAFQNEGNSNDYPFTFQAMMLNSAVLSQPVLAAQPRPGLRSAFTRRRRLVDNQGCLGPVLRAVHPLVEHLVDGRSVAVGLPDRLHNLRRALLASAQHRSIFCKAAGGLGPRGVYD